MYPLRMTRSLAAAMALAALAIPSAASAAELEVTPQKRCYSSGESVNLLGSAFTPSGSVSISRDGNPVGTLSTDTSGMFNGVLTLGQNRGKDVRTYTATDGNSITASRQITVSAVRVQVEPETGNPGRILTITASGFTTGKTLWAHVIKGRKRKHVRLGRLKRACGRLKTRKRLLRRNAGFGVYTIQFDTFRRYNPRRAVRDRYTITVRPV
jgi:hypothetical protein